LLIQWSTFPSTSSLSSYTFSVIYVFFFKWYSQPFGTLNP
jgi:hypothetical protein